MIRTMIRWVLIPLVTLALLLVVIRLIVVKSPTIEVRQELTDTTLYQISVQRSHLIPSSPRDSIGLAVFEGILDARIEEIKTDFLDDVSALQQMLQTMPENDRPHWKSELYITDTVFLSTNHRISLRLKVYQYAGGAHGMTTYEAFNYDVKQSRVLTCEDLIDPKTYPEVDKLLKKYFDNSSQCFTDDPQMDLLPIVNETSKGVIFLFPQYVLGPYSCGAAEILVPSKSILK